MTRLLVCSGEPSGDVMAAAFVAELKALGARPEVLRLGDRLEPVLGFVEGLTRTLRLRAELEAATAEAVRFRPDVAVLFAYSGFNLPFGRRLRRLGVPVLLVGPPQVWAWGGWRMRRLRRAADEVICLFRFEESLLRGAGVNASYHGWPLFDVVRATAGREQTLSRLGFDPRERYVLMLPGSRPAEREYHLSLFRTVGEMLTAGGRGLRVVVEAGQERRYDLMRHAECALAVSGTVTAELALLGTPSVVTYHLPGLSRLVARLVVRSRWFALPNIVVGERVVEELLSPTAGELAAAVFRLLDDSGARARLALVRRALGPGGGMRRSAEAALRLSTRQTA